jgi:hypothetical protein
MYTVKSVRLPDLIIKRYQQIADAEFDGNLSLAIRAALRNDLLNKSNKNEN